MTIRLKLILCCLALLGLDAGLGLFAQRWQHGLGEAAIELYDGAFVGLRFMVDVDAGLSRAARRAEDPAWFGPGSSRAADLAETAARLDVAVERALSAPARDDGRALALRLRALSAQTTPRLFVAELEAVRADANRLIRRFSADGLAARDNVEASIAAGDEVLLGVSTGVVLLSLGIAIWLGLSILPPLAQAVRVADSIAAGRLDTPIPAARAVETARLMRALDRMQAAIAGHIAQVAEEREAEGARREVALRRDSEEARERQRIAEDANRAKSAFLATMSHEIRTPMNAVLALADSLVGETLTPDQHRVAGAIHGASHDLMRILNDILDFSRLEAGGMMFEAVPFSPAALTGDIAETQSAAAGVKGLRFDIEIAADMPARVVGDGGRIGQVLRNLAGNAIKFTPGGRILVRARCLDQNNGRASLEWEVSDTGIGIAPDKMGGLFAAFAQADGSIARRFGGSGLGLAICHQLVTRMGGTIAATSEDGSGSTFVVRLSLPVAGDDPMAVAPDDPAHALAKAIDAHGGRVRLLLAEDNATNRFVFGRLLRDLAIEVDVAVDGRAAVAAADRCRYDLICMDMSMPEMDGLEATRTIRSGGGPNRATPIVAFTANAFPEDVAACHAAGMNDFVAKPINKRILFAAIARALDLRYEAAGHVDRALA